MVYELEVRCMRCLKILNPLESREGMKECPEAGAIHDVISDLMPRYSSKTACGEAMAILKNGGYDMHSHCSYNDEVFIPIIPIIEKLATRLMKYEVLNGARFHDSRYVCAECVKALSVCQCGHGMAARCTVCGAELVDL